MKENMSYEKFKTIMDTLRAQNEKRRRIGKFFEDELMESSFCVVTLGSELESIIIDLLANEFNCKFKWPNGSDSNDIEWWLYEAPEDKKIGVNGKEISLANLKDFYNYLISEKEKKARDKQ